MAESIVALPALAGGQRESWLALIELAEAFGEHWLLVGGQMVFLHEVERRATNVRPTDDVDVVVDLRADPAGLAHMHSVLAAAGFAQDAPSPDGAAHRYRRRSAVFDVLAPDNLGARASLDIGVGRTIAAPGTTQAFRRSSLVQVQVEGCRQGSVDLTSLASAVVKITSQSTASRAKHLRDFDSLAQMLGPADRAGAEFTIRERRLLTRVEGTVGLSGLGAAALTALLMA